MSIYYTNSNNREIFCHSINATVINGSTGPSPFPGGNNPLYLEPTNNSYTGINTFPFFLGSPVLGGTGGNPNFDAPLFTVTYNTNQMLSFKAIANVQIVDSASNLFSQVIEMFFAGFEDLTTSGAAVMELGSGNFKTGGTSFFNTSLGSIWPVLTANTAQIGLNFDQGGAGVPPYTYKIRVIIECPNIDIINSITFP